MTNPFNELEAQTQDTPTPMSAAMEIRKALSLSLTAKGLHRPRPLSWGKRIARTHFGWSRIGEKKWTEILEIGARDGLWAVSDKNKLVYVSEINDSEAVFVSTSARSPKPNPSDMSGFYRSAGAMGNWRVLTEDDWDGQTYAVIQLPWMKKSIEVPSWKGGQVTYELYDQKVREDIAGGADKSFCTSCKSRCDMSGLYPDSQGRIACSACNDRMDPRLVRPEGWVPPGPGPRKPEIKAPRTLSGPGKKGDTVAKLRGSVRKEGKADLMSAEEALTLAAKDEL